jgi:hypothetical protein
VRLLPAVPALACAALLAGCGSAPVDSGGLTAGDRDEAQAAMDALHGSNIPVQLVAITQQLQRVPVACRVHLESREPHTFGVYIFWVPYLGSQSYTWMKMRIGKDVDRDRFSYGTAQPVLPGGLLSRDGRSIEPWSVEKTLLRLYGPQQARKNKRVMRAHAGNAFSSPGAGCQVLMNGQLRLVPNAAKNA